MKILLDISGADKGFHIVINAAIKVIDKIDSDIALVGKKEDIINVFKDINKEEYINKFEIIECNEYISNNEEPAFAIKHKKESNLVKAFDYMKQNEETALISASSTGALMAGGLLKLGRIKKVHRPGLLTLLPSMKGKPIIFLDSGANIEAKELSIIQYALLGEVYAKNVLDIENPKIALLNVGAEEEKGTTVLKNVHKILKLTNNNFIGNIEPRYILNSDVNVVVCDGLMGNVTIKSLEGAVITLKDSLKEELSKNIINKIKALICKDILKNVLGKFDYTKLGGAVLIGIKKPVIKVHGSSNELCYEKALYQADLILKEKIIDKIASDLENMEDKMSDKVTEDINKIIGKERVIKNEERI